jgi:hypothetical protein
LIYEFQKPYLIKASSGVDWATLNNLIYNFGKWREEIGACNLRVKENFRAKETFITNIHGVRLISKISPDKRIQFTL